MSAPFNPYQAPAATPEPHVLVDPAVERARLRSLARRHRRLILAIGAQPFATLVAYVLIGASTMATSIESVAFGLAGFLVMTAVLAWASVEAAYVAAALGFGPYTVVFALFAWIPCLCLIPLAVVTFQATDYLQAHGIQVALLGADLRQFD